ncbi:MAG: glycoside hydrolase family 16 protein [Bacteroidaceae bacterium]|nr:glycoside hydrolase family 16 protein [Bacteroidaceae bacterium]
MKKTSKIIPCICLLSLLTVHAPFNAQTVDYPIVIDEKQNYTRNDRHLDAVSLNGSKDGNQTIYIDAPRKVYTRIEMPAFSARAGETVTPVFGYTGTWMHGFVYLDHGRDGAFEAELGDKSAIPEGSDIMAFSYAETVPGESDGYNSKGERVTNADVLNPPSFKIPEGLSNGYYRMRFKVDWASVNPAGRPEDGNGILKNGGAICDVRLNIHGDYSTINATAENGTITTSDGTILTAYKHTFGEPLIVNVTPAEGYICDALRIRHGHNLDGDSLIHGVPQYTEQLLPGFLFSGNKVEIPAEYIDGDVQLEAIFVKMEGSGVKGYPLSFDAATEQSNSAYRISSIKTAVSPGRTKTLRIPDTATTVYTNMLPAEVGVQPGASMATTVTAAQDGMNYYLYIDFNNDGIFAASLNADGRPTLSSELVSYTFYNGKNSLGENVDAATAGNVLPTFVISSELPAGIYRARLKADKNNIDPAGSDAITDEGGVIVDYLINIHNPKHKLTLNSVNGNIYGRNNAALPNEVSPYASLAVAGTPIEKSYKVGEIIVRHGHNLDGPCYDANGNRQWSEYSPSTRNFTIPADSVNGDVQIRVAFEPSENSEYTLVFSDEFNAPDGTQPANSKWMRCQRYSSTWNRWLSDSEEVIYLQGGDLVARAIPNPDTSTDNVPMITGGIKSNKRFGFTYGYVEARILTNPWVGNFPAFWMMPENQSAGWPDCGEIDIFETIDGQHRSWHTVHSNWTYDLGNKNNPKSSFDVAADLTCYNTYALEWDESKLVWYVNGKEVGRYEKSTDSESLQQGQWPFDKHFHLILNQSVGNGSWAANADVSHTYETRFDWVRVYQKRGMKNTDGTVGITSVESAEVDAKATDGGVTITVPSATEVQLYDLSGRKIFCGVVEETIFIPLDGGFYIVNGSKVHVR